MIAMKIQNVFAVKEIFVQLFDLQTLTDFRFRNHNIETNLK